jgi:hypothetical protein
MTEPSSHTAPQPAPLPAFWQPIAAIVMVLRDRLQAATPGTFAALAAARSRLAVAAALLRRYLHILAARVVLAPARQAARTSATAPQTAAPSPSPVIRAAGARTFVFTERARSGGGRKDNGGGRNDNGGGRKNNGAADPALSIAQLLSRARRLVDILSDPLPHARRLARQLARSGAPRLVSNPVAWHRLRRLPAYYDTLLEHFDRRANPAAWEGIDTAPDTA